MNNDELLSEITKWHDILNAHESSLFLETAFFKCFIKYEKFVSDIFEYYAIGGISVNEFTPRRILEFTDIQHLEKVIKKDNTSFINHFEVVKKLSDCIFRNNPFDIVFRDVNYSEHFSKMKILRDYIAHESRSARNKYMKSVLQSEVYISPTEYLGAIKRGQRETNYTKFINMMTETSNYLMLGPST